MKEDLFDKQRVVADWLNAFPHLTTFTNSKLYKIVGPTIIGIELIRLPHSQEYRPHFVIYSLWQKDLKTCLNAPMVLMEIYSKKGLQFFIPYSKPSSYFDEAVECLEKQILLPMNGDVPLTALLDLITINFNHILIRSNSAQQAKLFELEFYATLYTDNQTKVEEVLNQIRIESEKWNLRLFTIWYGSVDDWLAGLQKQADSRDEFISRIQTNKQDKKLKYLTIGELVA